MSLALRTAALVTAADALIFTAAAGAQERTISIPAGPLKQSLDLLARQTGISIGLAGALPAISAHAVNGRMSADTALSHLLDGTGWRARQVGPLAYRLEAAPPVKPVPMPPPAPPPPPQQQQPPTDDIIVTGMKRPLPLAQLPMSISVVDVATVRRRGSAPETAAVQAETDGMTLTNLGSGRNRQFIRGVADSPFNGLTQSTVSVVLDESRITYDAPDPDLRLVDVDRVEILKGPQGPLYGTGALGGIYHIVTHAPDLDRFSGSATTYGMVVGDGDIGGGGDVVLNLPLVRQSLGVRLVGYGAHEPGWIDTGARTDANVTSLIGGRAALLWAPNADWRVEVGAVAQLLNVADSQYLLSRPGASGSPALSRPAMLPEPQDNDFLALHASVTGRIAGLRVQSITGWVDHRLDSRYDASSAAAGFGLPAPLLSSDRRHYRLFTQEVRISNDGTGAIGWIAGASLLSTTHRIENILEDPQGTALQTIENIHQQVTEAAVFGELRVAFARWSLTGGARLFRSSVDDARTADSPRQSQARALGFTPSVALAWTSPGGQTIFLRYADALRPGGLSATQAGVEGRYRDDHLSNVELGTRGKALNGRLDFAAGAYVTFWTHVQSDYLLDTGIVGTRNAGDAHIVGIDTTLKWRPAKAWTVEAGGMLQHARLVDSAADVKLTDTRLPVVPEISGRLSIARRIVVGGWSGAVAARFNYTGPTRLSFDADLDRKMGDIAALGLGADLGRGAWTIGASLDNLLDSRADSFAFGNPFMIRSQPQFTPLRPRTFTLALHVAW